MSGKVLVRLVEAALTGRNEQVRILTNMLSYELRATDPELSQELSQMNSSVLRNVKERVNPHLVKNDEDKELSFLIEEDSSLSVEKPFLSDGNKEILLQVIKEHFNAKKLISNNLEPSKTLLFIGPPGVGKTITAKWLASELKLPIKILDLAMVMSSLLGKTGNNLKKVISDAAATPCVLLLDEFDAIAKKRNDDGDVGELKRLVTVLLQSIDSWPCSSILIAATNHPELLDPAIWRRFEQKINFELPTEHQIKEYLTASTGIDAAASLSSLFIGESFSDIKNKIIKSRRSSIINNSDLLSQIVLNHVKSSPVSGLSMDEKKRLAVLLLGANYSQRKVSDILDISRPTIKRAIEG